MNTYKAAIFIVAFTFPHQLKKIMFKNYFLNALLIVLLCGMISCEALGQTPTQSIQLQLLETNLSEDEKNQAVINIQKRLESLGAEHVSIAMQQGQNMTFHYHGDIKPETFEKSFSRAGKLEFFEVCQQKTKLIEYLLSKDKNTANEKEDVSVSEALFGKKTIFERLKIAQAYHDVGYVFGYISQKNKDTSAKMLIQEKPVYVPMFKKYVKFVLGKNSANNKYEVYAVYVSPEGKAAINESYVVEATAQRSHYNVDLYNVFIKMNEEGTKLWFEMTQHAYETRGNIAVVVDDEVYSTPSVSMGAITGGGCEITASLPKEEAVVLANAIQSGSIPQVKILKMAALDDASSRKN
ncbi:MAG: hypothetical protein AAF611_19970 [Bacteroidota bacterium]